MKQLDLELIKKKRVQKGYTLKYMADKMGFKNASTYLKYENGEYLFKANHLPLLSLILEINIQELFFEENVAKIANLISGR